jgi:hypothetical protein
MAAVSPRQPSFATAWELAAETRTTSDAGMELERALLVWARDPLVRR